MTADEVLPDARERRRALDVTSSFIVQAPAGSGKTELLIQRYLAFARDGRATGIGAGDHVHAQGRCRNEKARARRLAQSAGADARCARLIDGSREAPSTLALARAALQADAAHGWRLFDNPGRLRILTIDAAERHARATTAAALRDRRGPRHRRATGTAVPGRRRETCIAISLPARRRRATR
jgi:hypothetical protein